MKFEEILVLAVFITGFFGLLDILIFKKLRVRKAAANNDEKYLKESVLIEYSKSFFPVLLLVLILRSFLAEPFRIPSSSMKPTLLEGDFIVVNKFDYGIKIPIIGKQIIPIGKPKRGDIIVFRHTKDMDLIKRIVGLPGDRIVYKDKSVFINGKEVIQEYEGRDYDVDITGNIFPVVKKNEVFDTNSHGIFQRLGPDRYKYEFNDVTVPEGHYFVMGDNRDNSVDSRFWGFVADEQIIGRTFATIMSWDHVNKDVRWERIGKSVN